MEITFWKEVFPRRYILMKKKNTVMKIPTPINNILQELRKKEIGDVLSGLDVLTRVKVIWYLRHLHPLWIPPEFDAELPESVQLDLVGSAGSNIRYIRNPTPSVKTLALMKAPCSIAYIPDPTPEQLKLAIKGNYKAIKYLPEEIQNDPEIRKYFLKLYRKKDFSRERDGKGIVKMMEEWRKS